MTRKLPLSGGATVKREIERIREIVAEVEAKADPAFGATAIRLREAADALDAATAYMLGALAKDESSALAGAAYYLRLFGLALGGACLAKAGLAELALNGAAGGRVALARFFAEKLATAAPGLAQTVLSGAAALQNYETALEEFA